MGHLSVLTVLKLRQGGRVAQQVVHLPHNKRLPSVWSLHVLHVHALVLSGHPGFLLQTKNMLISLTGDPKRPMSVRVGGHLPLYVAL